MDELRALAAGLPSGPRLIATLGDGGGALAGLVAAVIREARAPPPPAAAPPQALPALESVAGAVSSVAGLSFLAPRCAAATRRHPPPLTDAPHRAPLFSPRLPSLPPCPTAAASTTYFSSATASSCAPRAVTPPSRSPRCARS